MAPYVCGTAVYISGVRVMQSLLILCHTPVTLSALVLHMVAAYVCGTAVYISSVRCTGSLIPLLLGAIFGKCVRKGGLNLWKVYTDNIFHSFGLFLTRTGITTIYHLASS